MLPMKNSLRLLREARDMTQEEVAQALNTTKATISRHEKGQNLKQDAIRKYVAFYGVSATDILSVGIKLETLAKIPIRGTVPGGLPMEIIDVPPDEFVYYAITGPSRNFGALYVRGDSVNNVAPDGSVIIVDFTRTDPADLDGKLVVAYAHGECTVKRLCLNPNLLIPDSTNKAHKPIILDGNWYVLDVVVGVINRLED